MSRNGEVYMRKTIFHFFALLCFLHPLFAFAQPGVSVRNVVKDEKDKFLSGIKAVYADSVIVYPLVRSVDLELNTIYSTLRSDTKLSADEKDRATRSMVYFIKELSISMDQRKLGIYDMPGTVQCYKMVLTALLSHQPLMPILEPLAPHRSQLMAASFSQYEEHSLLDDIAIYKRVASSPEFILQFLETRPDFRFADSLLLDAAVHDPLKIIFYLNKDKGVQDRIRNTKNIYLQQIAALSGDKNASELLPFVTQITENRISGEEVLEKRSEAAAYFQLLINTLQGSKSSVNANSIFLQPLRRAIKQKALSFYVNEVNDRHSEAESVRFTSVKNLRPQDLYYIITSCGEELYTSSYLGLYKRLMEQFKDGSADSLFDIVQQDDLRIFIRLAANYNVLGDFLLRLSPEKARETLRRFIAGIETDENTALERAMDIADSFTALVSVPEIGDFIEGELQSNFSRCTSDHHYLGIRLYSILSEIFDHVKQKDGIKSLWTMLGDYEVLKRDALANEKDGIVELVLFYGDEDGIVSFKNFLKFYADSRKWEVTKTDNWVGIRSIPDPSLVIYANRPLDIKEQMDLRAQDSLIAFLKEHSLEPTLLVHRGHSYHLDKTLKQLTPSVRLAILGSCGSYNRAISIASINPDVQVIGSKKTGSKSINDPIIDVINETLLNKEDLIWADIWKKLEKRFSKDETALGLFNEYFPPGKNLGLFVLKLFKYYNRAA